MTNVLMLTPERLGSVADVVPLVMIWHHVENLQEIQRQKGHLLHPRDKGRGNAKAKPKPKAKARAHESSATPASANAAWALQEEAGFGGDYDELNYVTSASACSFYTTFLPTFHAASTQDTSIEDHPENLPILHTGATDCLPPITWLGAEECEKAKRIHLKVATGTTVRAVLYNNAIYAKSVTRPLINVGHFKGMLDLRMIWDDSSPLIVVCYAGKK